MSGENIQRLVAGSCSGAITRVSERIEGDKSLNQQNRASPGILFCPELGNNTERLKNVSRLQQQTKNKDGMLNRSNDNRSDNVETGLSVDQKLVERVQKGDKRAFDLLVTKYQGRIAAIVSRYVSDHHEIADVTQEAFIKAYRAVGSFRGDSAFYTWIYRIAVNCAKNYLAAKGRRPPLADIAFNDAEQLALGQNLRDLASPESVLSKDQLARAVKQAVLKLPEDLRVALTLREFDGLSYEEISSVMNCPVGTVRSRIFRAREFVDQAIEGLSRGGK